MSDDSVTRVDELMREADRLGNGPTKVALLEEAVQLADLAGDLEAGYRARQAYVGAATFNGQIDRMMVAFAWCLSQHDRDPERFDGFDLLWRFKWVLENVPEIPGVSWQQIEELLADMTRRYEAVGSTMRAVYSMRLNLAMRRGDREAAVAAHRQFVRAPRDFLSDCPACEKDTLVDYQNFLGHDEGALEEAAPILSGRSRCAEVPHLTYARVLRPLLRLGRVGEAMGYHLAGARLIAGNLKFVRSFALHLEFLTLTDNFPRAVRLLEENLEHALTSPAHDARFAFFLSARLLLERLRERGADAHKLRLPAAFPLHAAGGEYRLAELEEWFAAQAGELARQFDARNGNDYYARRVTANREMKGYARPFPVTGGNEG